MSTNASLGRALVLECGRWSDEIRSVGSDEMQYVRGRRFRHTPPVRRRLGVLDGILDGALIGSPVPTPDDWHAARGYKVALSSDPPQLLFFPPRLTHPLLSRHAGSMLVRRTLSVLPFVALAYGGPLLGRNPKGKCDVGKIQCCQNVSTVRRPCRCPLMVDLMSRCRSPTLRRYWAWRRPRARRC